MSPASPREQGKRHEKTPLTPLTPCEAHSPFFCRSATTAGCWRRGVPFAILFPALPLRPRGQAEIAKPNQESRDDGAGHAPSPTARRRCGGARRSCRPRRRSGWRSARTPWPWPVCPPTPTPTTSRWTRCARRRWRPASRRVRGPRRRGGGGGGRSGPVAHERTGGQALAGRGAAVHRGGANDECPPRRCTRPCSACPRPPLDALPARHHGRSAGRRHPGLRRSRVQHGAADPPGVPRAGHGRQQPR